MMLFLYLLDLMFPTTPMSSRARCWSVMTGGKQFFRFCAYYKLLSANSCSLHIKCYWKDLDFAFSTLVFRCHVGFNRLCNIYYCYTLTEVWNVYYLEIVFYWICGGGKISNVYLRTCLSHQIVCGTDNIRLRFTRSKSIEFPLWLVFSVERFV